MRNSEGNEINYVCDESGRILESSLPSGKVNKFSYDANGNLTEITVPSGEVHQLNYNATNLALGSTNPQRGNTNSEYNSEQKPINKLLPSGRAIKNIYDRNGNLQQVSYPEADISISYLPKARGFQLTRTPADSDTPQKIAFGFDALLAPQLGFVETAIARQNRQRESQKLLLNAMIPDTGLEKALSRQTDGFLAQFGTFSYDRGLITEINYSGVAQGRYRYRYDNNFFLVGVKLDDRQETILQRDADGLLVQLGDFQMERLGCYDLLTKISDGCLRVSLEYDNIGRIVKRTHAVKGRVVYQLSLGYDGLYQIVQKQETVLGKTRTYDYTLDRDGQLIRVAEKGVVVESYSYDDNGNRIYWQLGRANPQTAKYDSQDRIMELGNVAYQFDDDGFMTQRGATSFEYSSRGELMKVMLPDGKVISYAYDGVGRRVARSSDAGTYEYLYGNPEKPFQVTAIREPSRVLSVYYYDDLGLLFAMQRDEDWFYVATDQLGTPIVVVDATGETVKVVEYDSFGNQVADSNPGFVFPIGFAAGLVDWETKLVRFGFRDYDPASGRWCAKDPIGFAAGDSNLYRYVNLNPVGLVDCSGEKPTAKNDNPALNLNLGQNRESTNLVCKFPQPVINDEVTNKLVALRDAAAEKDPEFAKAVEELLLQGVSNSENSKIVTEALKLWEQDPGGVWGVDRYSIPSHLGFYGYQEMSGPKYANVPTHQYKCNAYVAEVLYQSHGIEHYITPSEEQDGKYFPYQAQDWGNKSFPIKDFEIVSSPQPGDVWSNGTHVGIYLGKFNNTKLYASARDGETYGTANKIQYEEGIQVKDLHDGGIFRRYTPPSDSSKK